MPLIPTVRLINYEPNGQDTLSKIVRGELTADEVRGIVDPNYASKIHAIESTPTEIPAVKVEKQPIPEVEIPEIIPTPETEVIETKESNLDKIDTGSANQSQIQE